MNDFVNLVIIVTIYSLAPGNGVFLSIANGREKFINRLFSIIGLQVAHILMFILVVSSLHTIINKYQIIDYLRYIGATYFFYIGFYKFNTKAIEIEKTNNTKTSFIAFFLKGFSINIVNFKSIIFFVALLPNFVDYKNISYFNYIWLIGLISTIDLIVMIGYSTISNKLTSIFTSNKNVLIINKIFGVLFILVGINILLG